ncbi:MAG: ribonuclease HII, partial [Candidatus Staskawiczbacteria bacterium]|nr:ribonuclease HII [Candidatus Staskawiczbacteria bacterium]
AASIIAKVTRDRIMKKYHKKYPNYGFDKHKGYGTELHIKMIKKYGICKIHRKSFSPVAEIVT